MLCHPQVYCFKTRFEAVKGKISSQKLAEEYAKHASLAAGSEAVTQNFIDHAIYVHTRALSIDSVRQVVSQFDEEYGPMTVFDSVTKLYQIATQCKTVQNMTWAFAAIADAFANKLLVPGDLGGNTLLGRGPQKGILHLLLLKRDMLEYLSEGFLDKYNFDSVVKIELRSRFSSHAKYRKEVTAPKGTPENKQPDTPWRSKLPRSGLELSLLVEDWAARAPEQKVLN